MNSLNPTTAFLPKKHQATIRPFLGVVPAALWVKVGVGAVKLCVVHVGLLHHLRRNPE